MQTIILNGDQVWKDWFPNDVTKYALLVEKLLETDPDGRQVSNIGGYQSPDDLNKREEFKDLVDTIEQQSTQIHQELELIDQVKFTVINMWANINWQGHSNSFHQHVDPPSQYRIASSPIISGSFYLNVPQNSGRIGFYSSRLTYNNIGLEPPKVTIPEIFLKNKNNELLSPIQYYQPSPGDLLMFFADVFHGVEANKNPVDKRISISFNLGLKLIEEV